jgi:hypothetical protein
LIPDPPQVGVPLEVRVPLGAIKVQGATVRICREAGRPIAEVLLVRTRSGVWAGVIDGNLIRAPRVGLWIKIRQNGSYRDVLGTADQPIWVDVPALSRQKPSAAAAREVTGVLGALQKANRRPVLGFPILRPDVSLERAIDWATGLFTRRRVDGRLMPLVAGRMSDRYVPVYENTLTLSDPYDGSLIEPLFGRGGDRVERFGEGVRLTRSATAEKGLELVGGAPGRGILRGRWQQAGHSLNVDLSSDFSRSGMVVVDDHSSELPSYRGDRVIDDRRRIAFVRYGGRGPARLNYDVGGLYQAHGGFLGPWDTLTQNEWLDRRAFLLGVERKVDPRVSDLGFRLSAGYWDHYDQRELVGPGLILRDADGDGRDEDFDQGIFLDLDRRIVQHDASFRLHQPIGRGHLGVVLSSRGSVFMGGGASVNRSPEGAVLARVAAHETYRSGAEGRFYNGLASAEAKGGMRLGLWQLDAGLGLALGRDLTEPVVAHLDVVRRRAGEMLGVHLVAEPDLRLLDRYLDPVGLIAEQLSEGMPYGALLGEGEESMVAPSHQAARIVYSRRLGQTEGVWLYRLDSVWRRYQHSADGVNRSGDASPYTDDGPVQQVSLSGRIAFAAWSGLEFAGRFFVGQSFVEELDARSPEWVVLREVPQWRWLNAVTLPLSPRWSTGGNLEVWGPMGTSDRHRLTRLHRLELATQVRIDAFWRYQLADWSFGVRLENIMGPSLRSPLPRPDRVPELLPHTPRRVLLGVSYRPGAAPRRAEPFRQP